MSTSGRWGVSALLSAVLAVLLGVLGPVGRAAAEDGYTYGDRASTPVTLKISTGIKYQWWQCSVSGLWKVALGNQYLTVSGGCTRGWLATDKDGWFYADVPDCGKSFGYIGNLDQKDEVGTLEGIVLADREANVTGVECGAPTQLCMTDLDPATATDDEYVPGANTAAQRTTCAAWDVGPPPATQPTSPNAGGCPYVTGVPAVEYAKWRDAGTNTARYRRKTVVAMTGTVPGLANTNIYIQTIWHTPTGLKVGGTPVETGGSQSAITITGPGNWTINSTASAGTWSSAHDSYTLAGVQVWVGLLGNPPDANRERNMTSGWLGKTDGSKCTWYFGDNIAGALPTAPYVPAGPEGGAPVGSPPEGTTTPPAIEVDVDADGCATGAICVNPSDGIDPDEVAPPSVPDPDDASCNFSISDPSTWGGQLICALVSVAKSIIGAIGDLLNFLVGLVGQLGDLLRTLFIPDPSSWGLEGLTAQVNARAPFSIFSGLGGSLGDIGDGYAGATTCTGTIVDVDGITVGCGDPIPGVPQMKAVMGAALVALTAWYLFTLASSLVEPK